MFSLQNVDLNVAVYDTTTCMQTIQWESFLNGANYEKATFSMTKKKGIDRNSKNFHKLLVIQQPRFIVWPLNNSFSFE